MLFDTCAAENQQVAALDSLFQLVQSNIPDATFVLVLTKCDLSKTTVEPKPLRQLISKYSVKEVYVTNTFSNLFKSLCTSVKDDNCRTNVLDMLCNVIRRQFVPYGPRPNQVANYGPCNTM